MRGTVQGVGFRPFIYRRAIEFGLSGWVRNSGQGVVVEVEGATVAITRLLAVIRNAAPVRAMVVSIDTQDVAPNGETGFTIRASEMPGGGGADIAPDIATCAACLRELFNPRDRRYLHPFITCTQCGPRYSIVEGLPYDRARTSMWHFPMCRACRAEYESPSDRRFHAEPVACWTCGPRLSLRDAAGGPLARDHAAVAGAATAVRAGQIVAVKGIGGFHLLVDAHNAAAVARLRQWKQRGDKPFAVMFPSLATIQGCCEVGPVEAGLLTSPARPIVLLRARSAVLAQGTPWIGAMLAYAPVHHLLMRDLGISVVATSFNRGGEPIVFREQDMGRLAGIADQVLGHDRPIMRPADDSVVRVVCARPLVLRRARGYAPEPIQAANTPAGIVAVGGHLKATVAITRSGGFVLSQHVGDLDTVAGRAAHEAAIADACRLFDVRPRLVARDLHPDHASSQMAEAMGLPVVAVQHHVAHIAACMVENDLTPPAMGVAWDGTGYGPDGTVWGGEFLLVTQAGWRRVGHLRHFPLPGGEAAAYEPRRAALGLLFAAFGADSLAMADLAPVAAFLAAERAVLGAMLERGVNAPVCSSMGRLFDAFAALCGLRQISSYEGQAAAELEWAAERAAPAPAYPFPLRDATVPMVIDWQPALEAALADLRAGAKIAAIAAALHLGLAAAIVAVARRVGERRVILSGGCFQNGFLSEASVAALRDSGFEPVWHRQIPPNDGGIALGQAAWAAWREAGDVECASPSLGLS